MQILFPYPVHINQDAVNRFFCLCISNKNPHVPQDQDCCLAYFFPVMVYGMGDLSALALDKFLCFLSGCRLHDIAELRDTFTNRFSLFFEVFHNIRMSFLKVCIRRKNHFVYVIICRIFSVGIRDFAVVERVQTDMPCNVYFPFYFGIIAFVGAVSSIQTFSICTFDLCRKYKRQKLLQNVAAAYSRVHILEDIYIHSQCSVEYVLRKEKRLVIKPAADKNVLFFNLKKPYVVLGPVFSIEVCKNTKRVFLCFGHLRNGQNLIG